MLPEETRVCTSVIDPSKGEVTEIYEHSESISSADWLAFETVFREALEGSAGMIKEDTKAASQVLEEKFGIK